MDKNELIGTLYGDLRLAHEHLSPHEMAKLIYETWGGDSVEVQSQLALIILDNK